MVVGPDGGLIPPTSPKLGRGTDPDAWYLPLGWEHRGDGETICPDRSSARERQAGFNPPLPVPRQVEDR